MHGGALCSPLLCPVENCLVRLHFQLSVTFQPPLDKMHDFPHPECNKAQRNTDVLDAHLLLSLLLCSVALIAATIPLSLVSQGDNIRVTNI